ncbi:hypothetical protein ABLO26_02365 [Neobacillus sp. 179-J 1A1 HS]
MIKAESIIELAEKCQIEYEGLKDTFTRFNKFVEKGKVEDFG